MVSLVLLPLLSIGSLDVLGCHHLSFASGPLAWGAAFVAVVDLFLHFVAKLGVAVLLFGRHGEMDGEVGNGEGQVDSNQSIEVESETNTELYASTSTTRF